MLAGRSVCSRAALESPSMSSAWTLETCLWMDEGAENASSQQRHSDELSRSDAGIFLDATNVAKVYEQEEIFLHIIRSKSEFMYQLHHIFKRYFVRMLVTRLRIKR